MVSYLFKEVEQVMEVLDFIKDKKENLLKNVDKALYKAKEEGRNCVRYSN